jgi:hypothetical protein
MALVAAACRPPPTHTLEAQRKTPKRKRVGNYCVVCTNTIKYHKKGI